MSEELGFPPARLAATGFGEFRPIASNDTEEGRAQNRRIELKLTER
jgi:chemotaxis protein MotB